MVSSITNLQGVSDFSASPAGQRRALRLNITWCPKHWPRMIKANKLPSAARRESER